MLNKEKQAKDMEIFTEINSTEWDVAVRSSGLGSVYMTSSWEEMLADELPFLRFKHWRYRDTHVVRAAAVAGGRLTTVPFSEGSDVLALHNQSLDLQQFQTDVHQELGQETRLRINERFASVKNVEAELIVANEYVVDLTEPILPRVRKTLRHILNEPVTGKIDVETSQSSIDEAYALYVSHMREVRNFALSKNLFATLLTEYKGRLATWSDSNRPGAIAIFLKSGEEGLYSLSAANALALAAHAPHHLVYQALESFRAQGIKRVSLGATGKGSPLNVFKRGWRGEEYAIYELGERSGVSHTSKVRDLVRFVPLPLYPSLTSLLGKRLL